MVNRHNGTAQKDWVVVENAVLQEKSAIAVQAHKGWNQDDHGGNAKFVLVVSFEALDRELAIYAQVRAAVEAELQARHEVLVPAR